MVIGLLTLASIPVVTGVAEGISHQRSAIERLKDEKRMSKFYIDIYCDAPSSKTKFVHGRRVVLRDDKLWIDEHTPALRSVPSYTLKAFYLVYPDDEVRWMILQDMERRGIRAEFADSSVRLQQRDPPPLGLVSQVQDEPPLLNWIYVDRNTMEVKYGNRSASRMHAVGPWDWTVDPDVPNEDIFGGKGVTFEGEELFTAVEDEKSGEWQIYFDAKDDGLKGYVPRERRRLQISLERTMVAAEEDTLNVRAREADSANLRNMNGGVRVVGGNAQQSTNNISQTSR